LPLTDAATRFPQKLLEKMARQGTRSECFAPHVTSKNMMVVVADPEAEAEPVAETSVPCAAAPRLYKPHMATPSPRQI